MISIEQEKKILSLAYIPEQIPKLMCYLCEGDVELLDEKYLIFKRQDWFIFIAYPLTHEFDLKDSENYINYSLRKYRPKFAWLLTQKLPDSMIKQFKKIEDDWYFKLDIPATVDKKLMKIVEKAANNLKVSVDKEFTYQHKELIHEFLTTKVLSENVRQLYTKLPNFVKESDSTFFLNAYDAEGYLTAFYIVEMAAYSFSGYIIGCTSKRNYVPHSSDLLMYELIKISEKERKKYINLGIGVNEGIRRFKEKWGGVPFLKYETYEYRAPKSIYDYILMR